MVVSASGGWTLLLPLPPVLKLPWLVLLSCYLPSFIHSSNSNSAPAQSVVAVAAVPSRPVAEALLPPPLLPVARRLPRHLRKQQPR